MNPVEPSSGGAAEARAARIAQVLMEVAAQRQSGAELSDEQVCTAHPELMPELKEHLQYLQFVRQARGEAVLPPETAAAGVPPAGAVVSADSFAGYEILREIHRGGQGVVYQAIQKSTKRKVALKVMKEGPFATPAEQARFEREVQILGQLNHPNIVAIHDSGQAAGCHYFVMDYISGQPLDVWMAGGSHSIEETLKLFAKICSAVNAAHLRGITHRDLKPGNVRIDENGEPHILDFGLAKMAHSAEQASLMTLTGQFVGSLPWASPEQAEGVPSKIDLRTDVYSLGVILYQMLTGRFPYEVIGNMRDVLDRIMRAEPERPSTIRKQINDEVETIVLKCLQKERERRYQSAGELARDIGHYLAGEPIEAKRDSVAYVLRKYMRKYWMPTAVATGFVVVVTVGLIGSLTFWREAVVQRGQAEQSRVVAEERRVAAERSLAAETVARSEAEAARAEERQRADELKQVADFQAAQLSGIDVPLMAVRLRRGLLERVRAAGEKSRLDEEAIAERVGAFEKLLAGADLTGLSLALLDENIFERALKAIEKQFADQPRLKARLLQTIADVLRELGLLERATAPQTEALAIRRAQLGDEDADTLCSSSNLGVLLMLQGKLTEAEPYVRGGLESSRRLLGNDHPETILSLENMGNLLATKGDLELAERYHREALESMRRVLGSDSLETLKGINNVGFLLQQRGELTEAEGYFREALEGCHRVLGDDHPFTLTVISNMGSLRHAQGRLSEAEPYLRDALEGCRRVLGDDHPDTLTSINELAMLLESQGRAAEAEPYFRECLERCRRVLGNDHPHTLGAISNMGYFLSEQGRLSEAEPYYREAVEGRRRVLGNDHPQTLTSIDNMGALLYAQNKPAEAEPYFREALEGLRRVLGDDHPDTLISIINMSFLLHAQKRAAEATALLVPAEQAARRTFTAANAARLASFLTVLGRCRCATGAFDTAEANLKEAHAILSEAKDAPPKYRTEALTGLVELYDAWHAAEPGQGHDQQAAEWRAKLAEWQASTQPTTQPDAQSASAPASASSTAPAGAAPPPSTP